MMKKVKLFLTRLFLLNKRLLKKWSFVLILALIPLLTLALTISSNDESGVLTVLLISQDENDALSKEIINSLLEDKSIIRFEKADDISSAYTSVEKGKADALWLFKDNLANRIESFATKDNTEPLVVVVERETDVSLQLSHEKLSGCIFPYLSLEIFDDFMLSAVFTPDEISKEQVKQIYQSALGGGDIITFESVSGKTQDTTTNYLTAPLRGMLSLVVVLCGLAAVMYHQSDRENKIYDWLSPPKHIIFGIATVFSAVFDSTVIMVIALAVSGLFAGATEIISALVFTIACTAFCLLIGCLTRKASITGKLIPFIMIVLLVISPIFFNFEFLKTAHLLIPTYYYLYGIYSPMHILSMLLYSGVAITITIGINCLTEKA